MGERPEGTEEAADGSTATNEKLRWLTRKLKCYSNDGRRGRSIMNFLSYLGIGLLKEQGTELITCLFLDLFSSPMQTSYAKCTCEIASLLLSKLWHMCSQPISMLLVCKLIPNSFRLKQASSQLRSRREIPSQSHFADC